MTEHTHNGEQTNQTLYHGNRETVVHNEKDCTSGGRVETLRLEQAKQGDYTPCLNCLAEGWPDD